MTQREQDQQWIVELGDGVYVSSAAGEGSRDTTRKLSEARGWRRKCDAEVHAKSFGTIASVRRRKPASHRSRPF